MSISKVVVCKIEGIVIADNIVPDVTAEKIPISLRYSPDEVLTPEPERKPENSITLAVLLSVKAPLASSTGPDKAVDVEVIAVVPVPTAT